MKVKVVLQRRAKGGYLVHVLAVKGLVSEGRDKREALRNMKKSILLYLDIARYGEKRSTPGRTIREVSI